MELLIKSGAKVSDLAMISHLHVVLESVRLGSSLCRPSTYFTT